MGKTLIFDKSFNKTLYTLALPIAFQNLINTTLNAIDSVMIGALGSEAIAAVGFANQIFMILATMLFGVCTACCIFISQFYGKKDYENVKRSIGLNIVGVLIFSVIFTVLARVLPIGLMRLFTNDVPVINLGAKYILLVSISYIPMGISFAFSSSMRAVGKSYIPLLVTILSLFINAFFNYAFIFGHFGAPAMGVEGAAIGTIIARGVEFILLITIAYVRIDILKIRFKHIRDISKPFLLKFLKITAPVIMNEAMWSIGVAIYSAIFGRLSTDAVAAINIVKVLENMMLVFFQGIGNAAGIMVGQKIGSNDRESAIKYADTFTLLVPVASIIFSGIMIALRPMFLSLYNVSPEINELAGSLILMAAIFVPFKCVNYVHIVGTMRSGGDTIVCLLIDILGVWLVSIPLMLLSGIVLHLDVRIVYICSLAEEFAKIIIVLWRIKSRKWIRNLVNDM